MLSEKVAGLLNTQVNKEDSPYLIGIEKKEGYHE